jgi:demethylmenaquinone methyltransferase / 2-methoxy-6-polyprenyl-1,4-benzoquinol methylase
VCLPEFLFPNICVIRHISISIVIRGILITLKNLPRGEKKHLYVRQMFDRIAWRYDFMNRLITFGFDQYWRKKGLKIVNAGTREVLLDIACGTGDFVELALSMGATPIGVDFSPKMLQIAKSRVINANFIRADACLLPVKDASVDIVTCGFALRNFTDLDKTFKEMARVLAPGGRLMFLEVHAPENKFLKLGHSFYFEKVVPFIGALLSDKEAYSYLPRSVAYLPPAHELFDLLYKAGFIDLCSKTCFPNAAQLITGIKK